jgi:hypothetical protein
LDLELVNSHSLAHHFDTTRLLFDPVTQNPVTVFFWSSGRTSTADYHEQFRKPARMTGDTQGDMEIDTNVPVTEPTKRKAPEQKPKTIHFTSRNPPWTYLKLKL